MPQRKRPRRGSMAFFPKKRSKRIYPNVRTWIDTKETKSLGFAGFKAGMTHIALIDTNPNSQTKGQEITFPITILDCPPLSVFGFRCYTGNKSSFDVFSDKLDKKLSRKMKLSKEPKNLEEQLKTIPENLSKIHLLCHTNPSFKKKPETFELAIGGEVQEQIKYAKEVLGKEIKIAEVLKEGDMLDLVAI